MFRTAASDRLIVKCKAKGEQSKLIGVHYAISRKSGQGISL